MTAAIRVRRGRGGSERAVEVDEVVAHERPPILGHPHVEGVARAAVVVMQPRVDGPRPPQLAPQLMWNQVFGIVPAPAFVVHLAERLAGDEEARRRAVASIRAARDLGQELVEVCRGHGQVAAQGIVVSGFRRDRKVLASELHDEVVRHVVPGGPIEVGGHDFGAGRDFGNLRRVELERETPALSVENLDAGRDSLALAAHDGPHAGCRTGFGTGPRQQLRDRHRPEADARGPPGARQPHLIALVHVGGLALVARQLADTEGEVTSPGDGPDALIEAVRKVGDMARLWLGGDAAPRGGERRGCDQGARGPGASPAASCRSAHSTPPRANWKRMLSALQSSPIEPRGAVMFRIRSANP